MPPLVGTQVDREARCIRVPERVDLTEVVVTSLNEAGTMLRVDSWRPGQGLRRVERA